MHVSGVGAQFYDNFTEHYHLLFADWSRAVERQGYVLTKLLSAQGVGPGSEVLDASCGIGTQALGLAQNGYRVRAADMSAKAVERAGREARARQIDLATSVADLRALSFHVSGQFAAVISCDNAFSHLLSGQELQAVCREIHAKVRPGGSVLLSLRDYDALCVDRPRFVSERVFDGSEGRRVMFQTWDWSTDGQSYTMQQFLLRDERNDRAQWQVTTQRMLCRAWKRADIDDALVHAGFVDVRWSAPELSGFYQPVVVARRV